MMRVLDLVVDRRTPFQKTTVILSSRESMRYWRQLNLKSDLGVERGLRLHTCRNKTIVLTRLRANFIPFREQA